ncbi:MAG: DUF4367 domain-containing protein [Blautia sp.]
MSKKLEIDRKDHNCKPDSGFRTDSSAEDTEIQSWALQCFHEDASQLVERLEKNHQLKYLEPSEELFQKIVDEVRQKGLLEENKKQDQKQLNIEKKSNRDFSSDENRNRKEQKNCRIPAHPRKRNYLRWVGAAAITCFGLFGVSMSTEAGRSCLIEEITEAAGNKTDAVVQNGEKFLIGDTTEDEVRRGLENILQAKLPVFLYLPDGMELVSYTLDEEAQTVYMKYENEKRSLYSIVQTNYTDITGICRNDEGKNLGTISGEVSDITAEIWEIKDEGDRETTYLAQWDYKNSYYCISGKVSEQEIKDIVKNIMY